MKLIFLSEQVKLKKYFYALRPLLACQWIIEKKEVPPMEFEKLRTLVKEAAWNKKIDQLLRQKQAAAEKEVVAPIPELQNWIASS